jgi:hypothetical protein
MANGAINPLKKVLASAAAFLFLLNVSFAAHEADEYLTSGSLISQGESFSGYPDLYLVNGTFGSSESYSPSDFDQLPLQNDVKLAEITVEGARWSVHEDLTRRDGHIVFVHQDGRRKVFPKTAEAVFFREHTKYPKFLGFPMSDIGMNLRDILADALLKDGEPIEEKVAAIIPPMGSRNIDARGGPAAWTSFVGNVQANDNMPVFGYGSIRSFYPKQKFPFQSSRERMDGFVGGWMPAVRKVHPIAPNDFVELIIFGDVESSNPFIVPTWHRMAHIQDGKITRVQYARSYPEFGPYHKNPTAEQFYHALFVFGEYWNKHLEGISPLTLPDQSWADLTKYAFAKELLVRPGGVYPKYGAIDRDYFGMEYDGFQDIFTSSVAANLDWGRFKMAHDVIDNYFTLYTSSSGSPDMRGPETAQFGMTLALLTKYAQYTGDNTLLEKHKAKIIAIAEGLVTMHDEALRLPRDDPGHGLIHGWSESDACLKGDPDVYWKPYFANSAFSARGLKDISSLEMFSTHAPEWRRRSKQLIDRTVQSMRASVLRDRSPAYMPPLPGTNKTFRESMAQDKPQSAQDWPHRLYAELLHAAILPSDLANHVHDTMRSYGATSLGVVANVGPPDPRTRDLLGFISYGHAYSLLLHDRIDEFVLFMYSHRYHVHSRGAWNAAEVSGLNGDQGTFCIPAQLTIPSIVRWALVLEHPDEDILYLGRGVPRSWIETGKEISIKNAPTRWGKVDYSIKLDRNAGNIRVTAKFEKVVPGVIEIKLRAPKSISLSQISVNGRPATMESNEAVIVRQGSGSTKLIVEAKVAN